MYDNLVQRLNAYSAEHEYHGGITAEAVDAIQELSKRVPHVPHGRLIDADALKVSLAFAEKTAKWAVPALRAVLMIIDEMPTILPAEEITQKKGEQEDV